MEVRFGLLCVSATGATWAGVEIKLTPIPLRILHALADSPRTRSELIRLVWPESRCVASEESRPTHPSVTKGDRGLWS